ncbi:hypothetical protein DID78_06450 [Candidatus Marinamargulisbacteria bacterium SCGC AG-343-D04]|nr:hypothetical protein DID78_06450 [Candidatus Marinamargulisbacteria bacterium SCGC AG-343-D04]
MKQALPPSIAIIQSLTHQLNSIQNYLDPRSKENVLLASLLKKSEYIDKDERFLGSSSCIRYVQTMFLIGLSMFGGVSVSVITRFTEKEDKVTLTWDSGVTDTFRWGVYDEGFRKFAGYYQDRLSSKPQHRKDIPSSIFIGILGFVKSYIMILNAVDVRIKALIKEKMSFISLFESDMSKDILFITISSLPVSQINALFLHIQEFFPKDLEVTTPDKRKMNVTSLFQNPSVDISYLIEKTKIYCELFFDTKMPIIKEITQSKTIGFLKECFKNDEVYSQTQLQLKRLKSAQIDSRLMIYDVVKTHLDALV